MSIFMGKFVSAINAVCCQQYLHWINGLHAISILGQAISPLSCLTAGSREHRRSERKCPARAPRPSQKHQGRGKSVCAQLAIAVHTDA